MMRKSMLIGWLCLALMLVSCGGDGVQERTQELQQKLAAVEGYTAEVKVDIPRAEETLHYALEISCEGEDVSLTLTEPEMLAGITAQLTGDELKLVYDGLVLDAGTVSPSVSGMNCVPQLLCAMEEGYVLRASRETFEDEEDALYLVCESECSGELLIYRAYFTDEGKPLYGEIEKNEEIIAFMEFTNFTMCDTMP